MDATAPELLDELEVSDAAVDDEDEEELDELDWLDRDDDDELLELVLATPAD